MDPVQAIEAFLGLPALKRAPRRLLVALSGGADSVALLRASVAAAPKLGWTVEALHCDHGLRGRASEADAGFALALCSRLKVPLHGFSTALKRGPGLEERARIWRRTCYAQASHECGCSLVLLGHHAKDQAETVLLNLARGSGAAGAAGMLALAPLDSSSGVHLGRPFLGLEPEALRRWLRARRQDWREDASNRDLGYARMRVRHKILPELERVNAKAVAHLADFAASMAAAKRTGDLAGLLRLDKGARERASAALARGQGRADLGHGWSLDLSAGQARVRAPEESVSLALGISRWGDWRFELKLAVPTARKITESKAFWFGTGLLRSGPRLRNIKPGERLKPFGFSGRRKAGDLMREAGLPDWARPGWPAIEAEGRLLALPGVRRGEGFEALPGRKALRLTWKQSGMDKVDRP